MEDGLRLLVARFCERGMRTDRDDGWLANLGPSEKPLKAVLTEEIAWREFLTRRPRSTR